MVKANKYWYDNAQTAFPRILGSRWFEGLGTSSSMVFGVTTLLMVLFPSTSPKVNNMNGIIALIGIFLTPWFAAIDLFISINTWDYIGVGYFSKSGTDFLYIGGQLGIATSCLDFFRAVHVPAVGHPSPPPPVPGHVYREEKLPAQSNRRERRRSIRTTAAAAVTRAWARAWACRSAPSPRNRRPRTPRTTFEAVDRPQPRALPHSPPVRSSFVQLPYAS
ncbi:hypothetical protein DFJ73DRAFT_253594 [Zopfochytrium polystomum]|nr:hypothetical protein DFJ73DRAFT_253594 [Zopfochytrium polystomum]